MRAAPTEPGETSSGYLESNLERGALFLKDQEDRPYRISWGEESEPKKQPDKPVDGRRALAPGTYRVVGYRIAREDEKGTRWDLSGTHGKLCTIEIEAGKTERVEISDAIRIRHHLMPGLLALSITGEGPAGLTIYRDGRRLPIEFELRDARDEVHAKGTFRYG